MCGWTTWPWDWPPFEPAEVLAGVTGPRSLRLSGESADGTILTAVTPPDGVCRARRLIDEGRAAAGRTEPHRIVVYLLTATGPDASARLRAELTAEGVADVPELGVAGDAKDVAEAVGRLVEAGAWTVSCCSRPPTSPTPRGSYGSRRSRYGRWCPERQATPQEKTESGTVA
ncbi:hypothetical protein SGLAM104S_03273 [Streptomyces glaucescens]